MRKRYLVRQRARHVGLEYRFKRAITFDPTVESAINFYRSFRMLFFVEYMWNRYSVRRRSRRARPEYRFVRAITFYPTVGSPSNFRRVYGRCFPWI